MMMKMLEAGGMEIISDNIRSADDDNPRGYYEFERVKKLKDGDFEWLKDAQGKVVKIISALLENLPADYSYRIILCAGTWTKYWLPKNKCWFGEVNPRIRSTIRPWPIYLLNTLTISKTGIASQANIETIYINYNQILNDPNHLTKEVVKFLGDNLDVLPMLGIIDHNLYRQRQRM